MPDHTIGIHIGPASLTGDEINPSHASSASHETQSRPGHVIGFRTPAYNQNRIPYTTTCLPYHPRQQQSYYIAVTFAITMQFDRIRCLSGSLTASSVTLHMLALFALT